MKALHSRLTPALVGTLVVAVSGLLLWWEDRSPGAGLLQRLEWMSYDWRVRQTLRAAPATGDQLGLVAIDQATLEDLNRKQGFVWPIPRHLYGFMLRELSAQGAKAVGMDIFFVSEDPRSEGIQLPLQGGGTISADKYFVQQLQRSGNVILGAAPRPGKVNEVIMPLPMFRTVAAAVGHASAELDDDGVLRRVKPFIDDPKAGRVWQLGIALAARGLGMDLGRAQVEPRRIILSTAEGRQHILPLDAHGFLIVDWSVPYGSPRMREQNLLNVLGSAARRARGGEVVNVWKDRFVMVGSTASGNNISDRGTTPIGKNDRLVSTHWNIANSVLTGRHVHSPGLPAQAGLVAGLVLLAGLAAWNLRPLHALLFTLLAVPGFVAVACWAFVAARLWLPVVLPLGALVLTCTLLAVLRSRISGQAA